MQKLILFDIDGTLILSGGAGIRAMAAAFEETFGERDAFAGVPMPGRTDQLILADALAKYARDLDDNTLARFRASYDGWLRREIQKPGPRKGILPGVRELLEALRPRHDVFMALLTGNFEEAARIKLDYFGLWGYFACGAFGSDARGRNDLVAVAVERANACGLPQLAPRDVLVVGDTPLDIACAQAAGAYAVGVATGSHDIETLRASGADAVFEDLTDDRAFLALLG
jgi:phosphoglycolate phosphatase